MTVAVLAVVLTAPLGAVATSLLGPMLLKKSDIPSDSDGEEAPKDEGKPEEDLSPMPQEIELNGVYEGMYIRNCSNLITKSCC